jgi:hypothetical protein
LIPWTGLPGTVVEGEARSFPVSSGIPSGPGVRPEAPAELVVWTGVVVLVVLGLCGLELEPQPAIASAASPEAISRGRIRPTG